MLLDELLLLGVLLVLRSELVECLCVGGRELPRLAILAPLLEHDESLALHPAVVRPLPVDVLVPAVGCRGLAKRVRVRLHRGRGRR